MRHRGVKGYYLRIRLDCFKGKAVWIEWSARGVMGRGGKNPPPTGTFTYNALRTKTLKERIKTQRKIVIQTQQEQCC